MPGRALPWHLDTPIDTGAGMVSCVLTVLVEGGCEPALEVWDEEAELAHCYALKPNTLSVHRGCTVLHRVKRVQRGLRAALIMFYSTHEEPPPLYRRVSSTFEACVRGLCLKAFEVPGPVAWTVREAVGLVLLVLPLLLWVALCVRIGRSLQARARRRRLRKRKHQQQQHAAFTGSQLATNVSAAAVDKKRLLSLVTRHADEGSPAHEVRFFLV